MKYILLILCFILFGCIANKLVKDCAYGTHLPPGMTCANQTLDCDSETNIHFANCSINTLIPMDEDDL